MGQEGNRAAYTIPRARREHRQFDLDQGGG